jgi:glycosyltransferase involved in cell wall biosynthesis
MKILHVISSIDISAGGPSKSVSDLAVNLAKEGLHITLMTEKSSNPFLSSANHKNLKFNFADSPYFRKILKSAENSEEYNLFHGHGLWQLPVHQMARFARGKGIPYIISPRGMLEPWALNSGRLKKKIALWSYQRKDLELASCLHATSVPEAENIRKLGLNNPIAIIPNGIDLSEFQLPKKEEQLKKKNVLFFSRIHPKKGIELLVEAWQMLDKSLRQDWTVEITGNGSKNYIRNLQKLIVQSGLSDEIKITGPRYGVSKYNAFSQADLFVLPTYSENFGVVVIEALASGLPVITTKGTPWQELPARGAGWWIDAGVEPLKEALSEALSVSTEERKRMGQNGRKLTEENYSIGSVTIKMIQLYNWILNGGQSPEFVKN